MDRTQKPAPDNDMKFVPEGGKEMKTPVPTPKTGTIPGSDGNSKKPFKIK